MQISRLLVNLTHISTLGASYSRPSNNSGAAYGGLPHHVFRGEFGVKKLLKPKSAASQKLKKKPTSQMQY